MSGKLIAKIVLLGDGRVGKTSIRRRFMGKGFVSQHLMTLGADFSEKKGSIVVAGGNLDYTLQIWDIAGQDSFMAVRQRFLANTSGIVLVFDITNEESFRNLPKWLQEVWRVNNDSSLPLLVIGNKVDLEDDRDIATSMLVEFCDLLRAQYPNISSVQHLETSALTGENVHEGFDIITKAIHEKLTTKP